jgi:hypothetical protein
MEQQATKYLTENRKQILSYIRSKGLSEADAEDLLGEVACDVFTYYNPDRVKSVHLAVTRQLDMYYNGRGNVAPDLKKGEQVSLDDEEKGGVVTSYEDDSPQDPLEILILEEARSSYSSIIEDFTVSLKRREFLELVFVENFPRNVAADIAGMTRQASSLAYKEFMEYVGPRFD